MNVYFLDTGYLIALELANDQSHSAAVTHWRHLLHNSATFVTTSFVLDEVATFFNNRGHHAKAVEIGERLLQSPAVTLVSVDEELFTLSWDFFRQHHDKRYSLTDCTSFVLMQRWGISVALTFDRHFLQAGFLVEP